jgi:hypothetical protein
MRAWCSAFALGSDEDAYGEAKMRKIAIMAVAAVALAACQPANQDSAAPADSAAVEEPAAVAPTPAPETAPPQPAPEASTPAPQRPRAQPAPAPTPPPEQTMPDHDMSEMPNMEHPPGHQ